MRRSEEEIKITARLYECRDAARLLLQDSYEATVNPWRHVITERMASERLSVLQATLVIGQIIPPSDGVPLMMLMAAAVELIEKPDPPRED